MKSFPAVGWSIHFVHRRDVELADPRRPAYVLLAREGEQGWLFPVSVHDLRLAGYLLGEEDRQREAEEWVRLDPPQPWQPGKVPVILESAPLRLDFVSPGEVERRRQATAAEAVCQALETDRHQSLLERVASLEHADQLLGGHVIPVAALLALAREHGPAPELGEVTLLRQRLLEAAPSGIDALGRQLASPGFERVRTSRRLHVQLVSAALSTFEETGLLSPGRWQQMRSHTLWRWWLQARLKLRQQPLHSLADEIGISPAQLSAWLREERKEPPGKRLPAEMQVLSELKGSMSEFAAPEAIISIAAVHRPRLALAASQMADLERRLGQTERLKRWELLRRLAPELTAPTRRHDLPPWKRAEQAARRTRQELLKSDSSDPLALDRLLHATCSYVLAMMLPFERLGGEWAVGMGGAPVLGLSPALLTGDLGLLRFAVAHQIGHLLDSSGDGPKACCWLSEPEDEPRAQSASSAERAEAFANAFAVYLLAPRHAVLQIVDLPLSKRALDPKWVGRAARDVSAYFGISAGAAARHVLNCLEVETQEFQRVIHELNQPEHQHLWERARDDVQGRWQQERRLIDEQTGEPPRESVEEALHRPRSRIFDQMVAEASSLGLLTLEQQRELATAA